MHERVNLNLSEDFRNSSNLKSLTPADHGVQVYQRLRARSVEKETRKVQQLSQELSKSQSIKKPGDRPKVPLENLKYKLNRILKQNDADFNDLHYLYKSYEHTSIKSSHIQPTETSVVAPKNQLDLSSNTKLPTISINEFIEKHRGSILPRKHNTEAKNFFLRRPNK